MQQVIYGLQVDYSNLNGHYMVLFKENGLRRDELSAFQLNMLLANRIPRLLDMQAEELDGNIRLCYNITDKRMLSHRLRLESLSMKQFFTLLYLIADTVAESGVNMLQEGKYMIQEDYIYCGAHVTDIYITYVPVKELPDKQPVAAELQQLASRLVHKVSELAGSGYQELMSYLGDAAFNLPGLKALLLKHMHTGGQENAQAPMLTPLDGADVPRVSPAPIPASKAGEGGAAAFQRTERAAAESPQAQPPSAGAIPFLAEAYGEIGIPVQEDSRTASAPDTPPLEGVKGQRGEGAEGRKAAQKFRLPIILISILGLCLVWKQYLEHPGEAWLYICGGLSLLIGDLAFVGLAIWLPSREAAELSSEVIEEDGGAREAVSPEAILARLNKPASAEPSSSLSSFLMSNAASEKQPPAQPSRFAGIIERMPEPVRQTDREEPDSGGVNRSYYESLEQRTTLLGPPDATVLLKPGMEGAPHPHVPYLETGHGERAAKIRLDKPCFVIGRAGQEVDYEHKELGVSRLHAEIVRDRDSYGVKDLGSRNGTYVNGDLLAPYRIYELQEGDVVKIVNTEFIFKMGL
ncbi:DUF6382 domain-containing protein [Paenibacillus doosanensis]|uniref:FHA domain protein n=1 Tax=Paenibacillus konkukensis TaxID=2020716 RepID=A0ABY4RHE4_9BACL|nr:MULTISPECIES: DUF6382 domain-containing protein [Paenibacillus]MCS7461122.1 DUF6382 domain-containing protein [Paenibacillus doosanensis]UQZ81618.1 FHA domain protein [Paenibacillus konkukensis]